MERPLTIRERTVLDALLSVEFDGVAGLREQARSACVVGRCACGCPSVDFKTGGGMHLRVNAQVRGSCDGLFLYTLDGDLGGIEWVGVSDQDPAESLNPDASRSRLPDRPQLALGGGGRSGPRPFSLDAAHRCAGRAGDDSGLAFGSSMARVVWAACAVTVAPACMRPRETFCAATTMTPVAEARRCTGTGSVEGRGTAPTGRQCLTRSASRVRTGWAGSAAARGSWGRRTAVGSFP